MSSASTPPTVSVVIPSYRPRELEAVLDGLERLNCDEIIVVDSSQEPPKTDRENVKVIALKERAFAGKARNEGARRAKGDFLVFVDSDVVFTEKTIDFINEKLADFPNKTIFTGQYARDHQDANLVTRLQNRIVAYRYEMAFEKKSGIGGSSHMLMRRGDFLATGGFNENLETYEDIEFVARARYFDLRTVSDPSFEVVHLKKDTLETLVKDYWVKSINAYQIRKKFPGVFKGMTMNIGAAGSSWLAAGAALPVLLVGSYFSPLYAVLALIVLLGYSTYVAWADVMKGDDQRFKIAATPYWWVIGLAISAAGGLAFSKWVTQTVLGKIVGFSDLVVCGLRALFKYGKPVQLITYITGRCNLRCGHCFYKETLDKKEAGEIQLGKLDRVFRDAGPLLWFSLAGGEPYLRGDLPELVSSVQRRCRPKVLTMPTNGWYVDRTFKTTQKIMQGMDRGNLFLVFSVDGPKEIHDKIRGKGSYDRVRQTIKKLRPLQKAYPELYLGAVMTVTPDNMAVAPDFVEEIVEEFSPNFVSINLYRQHDLNAPPVGRELLDAHEETLRRYETVMKSGKLKSYDVAGSKILRLKEILQKEAIQKVARNNEFVTPCVAGNLSYVVYEDGRVSPCEILNKSIGSLTENGGRGFSDVIGGAEAEKMRQWIVRSECKCTYECAMSTNVLFSWPLAGELYKRAAKSLFSQ